MIRSAILSAFVLFSTLSFSQRQKGSFIIAGGAHYCQNSGVFNLNYNGDCLVGSMLREDVKQTGATFFDAAFLYRQPLKFRISLLLGIGLNQKGFVETGMQHLWNETQRSAYASRRKLTYTGIMAGISVEALRFKKVSVSIAGLINPELLVAKDNYFERRVGSARAYVDVAYKCSEKMSLHLMPFCQTALDNYSKKVIWPEGQFFRPYSAGINVGVSF